MNLPKRLSTYGTISTELSSLSDQRLVELLSQATPLGKGIGGTVVSMEICGTQVFAKKVRGLTDLERRKENYMSTENLFKLPTYCQYGLSGIGSPGFGAWRELSAQIISTNWVINDECPNFPLMYHWRILPRNPPTSLTPEDHMYIEDSVNYWDGSSAVRTTLEAMYEASAEIVLFLEYIPQTLHKWFVDQIVLGSDAASSAVKMVERNLHATTSFMKSRSFLHFDAHFNNILTDGQSVYFADFGLALCSSFSLSKSKLEFFEIHRNYDRYYTLTNFVHWLGTTVFGAKNCNLVLQEYAAGKATRALQPPIEEVLRKYAPVAIAMKNFFQKFQTESRAAQLPVEELEHACAASAGYC